MTASLSAVTAATIPFTVDGIAYNFRPLTLSCIGQLCRRYTDAMLPTLVEPGPLMQSLIGHEKSVVMDALQSLKRERAAVVNPDPGVVLDWVIESDIRVAEMLCDCIVGESKPDIDALARAMKSDTKFWLAWLEASGMGNSEQNPTTPPTRRKQKAPASK